MKSRSLINKNLFGKYDTFLCLIPLIAVLILFLFIIPFDLLFAPTLPSGGDHPGHFYNLNIVLETLHLRNWNPANLAGEVLNGHYFPMMFLLLTPLSYMFGPLLAYKLFLTFSIFSIPLLIYFLIYKKSRNHLTSSVALFLSLILNFYFTNFNWGLSAFSSLIGLVSHNLAFFFFLLFLDRLLNLKSFNRIDLKILFYILGTTLSHPYVAINIPIVFICFSFFQKDKKEFYFFTLKNLFLLILLSLWWLLPMLNNLENNSSFSFRYVQFRYWKGIFSKEMLLFLLFISLFLFFSKKENISLKNNRSFIILFALFIFNLICLILFPFIGLVDARVLGHLFFCLFAFLFFFSIKLEKKYFNILAIIIFLSFLPLHFSALLKVKTMLRNSWQGPFHSKQAVEVITKLKEVIQNEKLNNQNRIAYEFNPFFLWQFGSDRFFETLPPLINKPTFDGLYIQANQYSKYAHYFQSLLGNNNQCLKEDKCSSKINLKKAAELMPILGIDTLLLTSFNSQQEAKRSRKFFDHYIELPFATLLIKRDVNEVIAVNSSKILNDQKWKKDYYNYLKNSSFSLESDKKCHPVVTSKINQLILVTDCLGKPHILKYMYTSGFRFSNAHVFRAPYGYIGIVPFSETTDLDYGETFLFILTKWISLLSFVGLTIYFLIRSRLRSA